MSSERVTASVKADHVRMFAHAMELANQGKNTEAWQYFLDNLTEFRNLAGALNAALPSEQINTGPAYTPNSGRVTHDLDTGFVYALPVSFPATINPGSTFRIMTGEFGSAAMQHQVSFTQTAGDFSHIDGSGSSNVIIRSNAESLAGQTWYLNVRYINPGAAVQTMAFEGYLQ